VFDFGKVIELIGAVEHRVVAEPRALSSRRLADFLSAPKNSTLPLWQLSDMYFARRNLASRERSEMPSVPPRRVTAKTIHPPSTMADKVIENPYLHFIMSEMWAALAAISSYALFRFGAFATQWITGLMPLQDPLPALFLESTLSWGAAISASATFAVVSLYQLVVLVKRLWERF
jgi:hypothetical protein